MASLDSLITSYFGVVRKNIQDLVPKAIMCFLVNQAKDNVHNRLVGELYKKDLFEQLLQEDAQIAELRSHCHQALELFKKAAQELAELRDGYLLGDTN